MKFYKVFLKKNLISLIIIVILFLGIIISGIFFISKLRKKVITENKINSELTLLNLFKGKKEYAPTTVWIRYSKEKRKQLGDMYKQMMKELNTPFARIPEGVKGPLKFKEEIFNVQDKLRQKADSTGLILEREAQSLGFQEYEKEIPTKEEIPKLTKKLHIAEELVELIFASKIDFLENIEFLECRDNILDGEDALSYRVIPVKLEIISSLRNLARFLYFLSESKFIFVVNDININSSTDKKDKIRADLDISTIVFLEKKKNNNEK